jgi:hypothetical protein
MIKKCAICGKKMKVFPSNIASGRGKYCSHKCYLKGIKAKKNILKCDNCGKEISRPKWYGKSEGLKHTFCSYKCFGEYRKRFPEEFPNYKGINKSIEIDDERLRDLYVSQKKTIRQIADIFNCGYGVIHRTLKEINVPMRNRGDYSTKNSHTYWQRFLNKKYNHTCQICGWNKTVCDIHHKVPLVKGGKNTEENLILVCPNCHRLIHKKILKI